MAPRLSLRHGALALVGALLLSACSDGADSPASPTAASGAASPTAAEAAATTATATTATATATATPTLDPEEELRRAPFSTDGWATDFTRRNVVLADITSGGPPRDGIPSIDSPRFVTVQEAAEWLDGREPVQVVEIDGDARAYPTQILIWHEIVNDTVGGQPVAVTYCPLCNTAIVFNRVLPDVGAVEFGVSGNLYGSAMIMYDRTTESWFWQVSGTGIVGELTDLRLEMLPSTLTSFDEFRAAHPTGSVLSRETGFNRNYGQNPYVWYDTSSPFLFRGERDGRLSAMERVVTVERNGAAAAFPFSSLVEAPVVYAEVGGDEIVVLYRPGAVSPLDEGDIVDGRDVGSSGVYLPVASGERLTFEPVAEGFRDQETRSTWNLLGEAIAGPLSGERLEPVVHGNHFWFSWAVYQPETRIITE